MILKKRGICGVLIFILALVNAMDKQQVELTDKLVSNSSETQVLKKNIGVYMKDYKELKSSGTYRVGNMIKNAERREEITDPIEAPSHRNDSKTRCSRIKRCIVIRKSYEYLILTGAMGWAFFLTLKSAVLGLGSFAGDLPQNIAVLIVSVLTFNYRRIGNSIKTIGKDFWAKDWMQIFRSIGIFCALMLMIAGIQLFALPMLKLYVKDLGDPFFGSTKEQMINSIAFGLMLGLLKAPVTAVLPPSAGVFGALTGLVFPNIAVFAATIFSGLGLLVFYMISIFTGLFGCEIDILAWIGDMSVVKELEFTFPLYWRGLSREDWQKETEELFLEYQPEGKTDKEIRALVQKTQIQRASKCVQPDENDDSATVNRKLTLMAKSLIFFRVFFPGFGDSLLNTYARRYEIGFIPLFISLFLGLVENTATSYASQIIKHPQIATTLFFSTGIISSLVWIGKYAWNRGQLETYSLDPESFGAEPDSVTHGYAARWYGIGKDLLRNILTFVTFVLGVVFVLSNPGDLFDMKAYWKDVAMEDDVLGEGLGEGIKSLRSLTQAWGAFGLSILVVGLFQFVIDTILPESRRVYDKAGKFSDSLFKSTRNMYHKATLAWKGGNFETRYDYLHNDMERLENLLKKNGKFNVRDRVTMLKNIETLHNQLQELMYMHDHEAGLINSEIDDLRRQENPSYQEARHRCDRDDSIKTIEGKLKELENYKGTFADRLAKMENLQNCIRAKHEEVELQIPKELLLK